MSSCSSIELHIFLWIVAQVKVHPFQSQWVQEKFNLKDLLTEKRRLSASRPRCNTWSQGLIDSVWQCWRGRRRLSGSQRQLRLQPRGLKRIWDIQLLWQTPTYSATKMHLCTKARTQNKIKPFLCDTMLQNVTCGKSVLGRNPSTFKKTKVLSPNCTS